MQNFWIVWSPNGGTPPRKRHYHYSAAKAEAERLAELAWPSEFFVLRAVSCSRKISVVTEVVGDGNLDEKVPF